ncbi:YitT family protein [Paenibacillus sp.]|uniref:YitT family protein n=1 Tax=Paenibacillus sp. TaxID=58172 RepID=UPI002D6A27C0|nr:YitT family protein [Paenibacillus sp.]HZG86844.1 YitT family protein [Paenibacillus sp.]
MMRLVRKTFLIGLALCITSIGMKLLAVHELAFGGTAGVAFLLSYTTPLPWSFWFAAVNLPFFLLSIRHLGWRFTWSTLTAIMGISLISHTLHRFDWSFPTMPAAIAAVASGICIGAGISVVLNNGSSLGGVQIFALVLDRLHGINRGASIFVTDFLIVAAAAWMLGWSHAAASVLSIAVASLIVGRYKRSPLPEQPPGGGLPLVRSKENAPPACDVNVRNEIREHS